MFTLFYTRNGVSLATDNTNKPEKKKTGSDKARMQVIKMLIIVWILFVLCWGPYLIYNIVEAYDGGDLPVAVHNYLYPIINLLAMCNSALNPLLYALMSR